MAHLPPPNVAQLPHDVADFTLSMLLPPRVDDDRAAAVASAINEGTALWLVQHRDDLVAHVSEYAGLRDDETLEAMLGPRPVITSAEDRLAAEAEL